MGRRAAASPARMLFKDIVNCRNAASAFRMMADCADDIGRHKYLEIAASYENTARMLEDLQRQSVLDAGNVKAATLEQAASS
jgi:hypothetical protein